MVGFRESVNKLLQIRISGNHKGRDRNVQFSRLSGLGIAFFGNVRVQSVAINVIPTVALANTAGFAICDHKNLFIGILFTSQNIHGQLESGNGIGMVRTYLQVGNVFYGNGPCIVTKNENIDGVFWISGGDEFGQGHRNFFRRRDAVFPHRES